MAKEISPFGHAQTRLFLYIFKHPGCSTEDIWNDEFPDATKKYVNNLLYENSNPVTGIIERRTIGEGIPTEHYIKIKTLCTYIDFNHYITTGKFRALRVQGELPLTTEA